MAKARKSDIELENGEDLTDFLQRNGKITDEKVVKNGTSVLHGMDIWDTPSRNVEWAVKDMIPMRKKTVAVGDFEAGKSYLYLGAALSIAGGKTGYIGFEIPKMRKVLYVDLENGVDETLGRIRKLTVGHQIDKVKASENLTLITKPGDFEEVFPLIETQVIVQKPDVIIIDNLYQLSGASNISDADKIKPLLTKIERLKEKSDAALVVIHHFNKNTQDQGIAEERMAGSSVINWWYEHCLMVCKTNQDFSLLAVGKSRMGAKNPGVYGIEINDQPQGGVAVECGGLVSSDKIKGLVVPEPRKTKWEHHLNRMADDFETHEWLNVCGDAQDDKVSDVTAHRWLGEMAAVGIVKKLSHGRYKKTKMTFYETN
tara:strand:- start:8592 stop:9704 length:1113 start_codon:yes stop_codon:yes gene_type:complete